VAGGGRRVVAGSLLGAAFGAAFGALFGLVLARWLWAPVPTPAPPPATATAPLSPATATGSPTAALPTAGETPLQDEGASEESLVVIGALYALDGDLARAQQRLAGLGLEDPAAALADLALDRAAAGQEQVAVDLATLAAALGHRPTGLLAYVASPTPTATAMPTLTPHPSDTPFPTLTLRPSDTATPQPTRRPAAAVAATAAPTDTPLPPAPTALPWDWWDHRVDLLEPPVRLAEAQVAPGERYWRLVRLEWWKPGEGGNTMIYVSTLDEQGRAVWRQEVVVEHGDAERLYTDPKPGEPYGVDYPMGNTLNSYQVFVGGALPSDRVTGLGLGEYLGGLDHTTFVLVFQLTRK